MSGVDIGWWVLVAAVVLTVGLGLVKRWYDGRFRPTGPPTPLPEDAEPAPFDRGGSHPVLSPADLDGATLGDRATLVHFASAFCVPCRAARQVLTSVGADVDGVTHVEIDAESHLDLVRRLDIRRTPTVLVLDSAGRILTRASGPPRRAEVLGVLGALT